MSTLLEQASLIMIPSGYKEDVVYSVIPETGAGDLSFTRASNGTRINSAGLVEVTPWNLVQQSETFDNAYWSKNRSSISANSTTAPNGTATADSLIEDTANGTHEFIRVLPVDLQTYNLSIYAKANTRTKIQLVLAGSPWATGGNGEASFDLTLGTVISAVNGATGTIESVGNGWYRCTISKITSAADPSGVIAVRLLDASANASYTGNGTSGAYYYGAQLNIGATAKPYFPTTDRLNVPRLTYQNGGGGCPSLLLEKQSTNLVSYSEDFTNATYTKIGVTATGNTTTSPDGTTNADSILEIATGGTHESWQRASMTSGQLYTQSCFLKANGRNRVVMQIFDNATQYASAIYDLSTGVVVASVGTATIQSMGNGWYRCTITGTSPATGSGYCVLGLCESTYTNSSVMPSYSGDASKGVYWWGFQVENSSYPTSYIPTTSASATRVADVCSKTGISSLIGQTEGTILWDVSNVFQTSGDGARLFVYTDGNNFILISPYANTLRILIVSSGTAFDNFITISGTSLKIAVAYKANDYKFYVNGVSVGTPTATSVPAMNSIGIVNDSSGSAVTSQSETKQLLLFKTRLTNAELASLTTL